MAPALKKYIKPLAIAAAVLVIFVIVDVPQTVRTKALFVNMLPIDAQTKVDVVDSLCKAAYGDHNWTCYFANTSAPVREEAQRQREERERCDKVRARINGFDWTYDPQFKFYVYVGLDQSLKDRMYFPESCSISSSTRQEWQKMLEQGMRP